MQDVLKRNEGTGLPTQALLNSRLRAQQLGRDWLLPLWQRLLSVRPERWRRLLLLLCAVWVLANLARLVWLFLPMHSASAAGAAPVNAAARGKQAGRADVDIDALAGWHLFGEAGAEPRAAKGNIEEEAENTSLNLQLLGAINANEPALARAIILAEGRQQQFAIGEQLPGSGKVVLSKVLDDRVILDNNGRYETLWLYDPSNTARRPRAPVETAAPAPVQPPIPPAQSALRERLTPQRMASLSEVIQIAPVSEGGKLLGYRVRPGRDQQHFARFGFQPDDVITGVNDVNLDDPQRALELYNTMRTAKEATFSVRRAGGDIKLKVSLDNNNDETQ